MSITRGMTKALLASILGLGLVAGAVSCGGATTNNDQGTSFLAFGYFTPGEESTPISGLDAILAPDSATIVATSNGVLLQADGGHVIVKMGIQNRLTNQFMRVERIECGYSIPGAAPGFNIPNDSFNTAVIISASPAPAAAATDGTAAADSGSDIIAVPTDGPGGSTEASAAFTSFDMVSPDIMTYINVNRNSLPELPFRLNVVCRAVGVSQAGDVFITNDLQFQINFFDQAECCTGATFEQDGATSNVPNDDGGFQGGVGSTGTGGDFVTGSDEDGDSASGGSGSSSSAATT